VTILSFSLASLAFKEPRHPYTPSTPQKEKVAKTSTPESVKSSVAAHTKAMSDYTKVLSVYHHMFLEKEAI
jgi:hypothetical protein